MKRELIEELERKNLKPYACFSDNAERLLMKINKHPLRTDFQRDRDRIIHSKSFRRLEYKTQVFSTQKGDHLRTRLTHSLEVSQLGRTIAMQLGLNVDLVEAIALGHDVGHTPFGHAAERALNKLLQKEDCAENRFKHNAQGVKIFHELEKKYEYDGLNLTIPVLEGILKHTKIPSIYPDYFNKLFVKHSHSVTLEGQVVAIADEIAQITHDMDDYLRYEILDINDFFSHEIFKDIESFHIEKYDKNFADLLPKNEERKKEVLIRCLVDYLVTTLVEESEKVLHHGLEAYKIDKEYINFGSKRELIEKFQKDVSTKCLSDFRVKEMDERGKTIIESLYKFYKNYPEKLPKTTKNLYDEKGVRVIVDYISGMTDRYAISKYNEMIV